MDLCVKIDDIVWGQSEKIWDEIFSLLVLCHIETTQLVNVVMKWVLSKIAEFDSYYQKVLHIMYENISYPEEVRRFANHYCRIVSRYKTAYSCCRAMEYSL